jgi:hypothetical protein
MEIFFGFLSGLTIKEILGYSSIFVVVLITVPYWRQVLAGKIKPHIFTWVIWSLTTGIAAAARMTEQAGAGAWGQWAGAFSCLSVAILAIRYGEKQITRSDWVAFILALAVIPIWQLTQNALLAVIAVTFIDILGYYPTFRKAWARPYQEAIFNSLLATETYSLTNILFQIVVFIANSVLIVMVLWRRSLLSASASPADSACE